MHRTVIGILVIVAGLVVAACSSATPTATPAPTPTSAPTPNPFAPVPGIVDPANMGWPRQVEALNGLVTIEAKPLRIVTLSVGHDELTYALVPASRVIAVGGATKSASFSNVAGLTQDVPTLSREPEVILAQNPDIMATSPFVRPELIDTLTRAGLTVVQTSLENDPEARIHNILLLGYIYGEEERAVALASEVQSRYDSLIKVTQAAPPSARPRVLSLTRFSDKIWTAGSNSTEGGIIEAAGGINPAAEAGIGGNQTTSLEGVIAMAPEVIIIPQPADFGAEDFRRDLLNEAALAEVPAIKAGRVHIVDSKLFITLSFWNIRGAEELSKVLWPEEMGSTEFPPFSFPN